jgi:hypothetical protein
MSIDAQFTSAFHDGKRPAFVSVMVCCSGHHLRSHDVSSSGHVMQVLINGGPASGSAATHRS